MNPIMVLMGSAQTPVERLLSSWKGPSCTSTLIGGRVCFEMGFSDFLILHRGVGQNRCHMLGCPPKMLDFLLVSR